MYNFLIAPDFPPKNFAGWHILNAILQKHLNERVHLLTPASAVEQADFIQQDIVDLIYANPFDSAELVRERGYLPLARPIEQPDEMVIASSRKSSIEKLTDLKPGMKISLTNNQDMKLIGLRLLESVDLTENDLEWIEVGSFQAAARLAINQETDAAFFVASAYHSFSTLTTQEMNVLIESHIHDIYHIVLAHPRVSEKLSILQEILVGLKEAAAGKHVFSDLNIPKGFDILHEEDMEFMIDLMDTLLD